MKGLGRNKDREFLRGRSKVLWEEQGRACWEVLANNSREKKKEMIFIKEKTEKRVSREEYK